MQEAPKKYHEIQVKVEKEYMGHTLSIFSYQDSCCHKITWLMNHNKDPTANGGTARLLLKYVNTKKLEESYSKRHEWIVAQSIVIIKSTWYPNL